MQVHMENRRFTIALVEDNPLIRVPIARGLDQAGYQVIGAADGVEALSLLADPGVAVAVVDVNLAGRMSGLEAVAEARRGNPTLKVIFVSGELEDGPKGAPFLRKPYQVADLLSLLSPMVSGGGEPDRI
ncbi:MAG: response regulator [Alphaproteobacteria bacterium]|nr:response regulator [Alphaproteobacteria bacterium]